MESYYELLEWLEISALGDAAGAAAAAASIACACAA